MDYAKLLSVGAIAQILDNHKPANPVLQILGYKPMTPDQIPLGEAPSEMRYRLMIGDGQRAHQYCVITNQDLVNDIRSGHIEKWSIVRVTSYQTVDYGETPETKRRLIYILNLEIVERGIAVGHKIAVSPSEQVSHQQPAQQYQPPQAQETLNQNINQQNRPAPTNGFHASPLTQAQPYPLSGIKQDLIKSPRSMKQNYESQTIPIAELTPYIGKWIIKGRVTSKSAVREYNNARGGGKLFNFVLADKSGEVKVTAFNADLEKVFPIIETNRVYILTRAQVKSADKRYTSADIEITLQNDSLIEEISDSKEANDIPLARFNFVSIGSLTNVQPNQTVDLIGAITQVGEFSTVISRTKNKELKKRNVTIVDMSRHSISVTIWGDQAETFSGLQDDVFVTKGARIGTYGGRSASAGDCIFVNPEIPEVRKLRNWYQSTMDRNFTALTMSQDQGAGSDQWRYLSDLMDLEKAKELSALGQQSALYAKSRATVISVGKNPVYKCCPQDGCGKKLMDTQNGELKCEKCQQTYSNYRYRYKTDIEIGDHTASSWVTLWDEKAENLFGMKPEELERYMRMENKEAYESIITKPNFRTFSFTMRSRVDTYNQEERVKLTVTAMSPDNPTVYAKRLMDEIRQMLV